jgi:hypothetical protein
MYRDGVSKVRNWASVVIVFSSLLNILVIWLLSQLRGVYIDIIPILVFWFLGVIVKLVLFVWQHLKR